MAWLLILPLGALVTSIIRNVVGVQTYGTLTPSLLAISFLQADWLSGGLVFGLVMGLGLGGRALLGRLKLLMGPRLGLVLTFVVLGLAGALNLAGRRGYHTDPAALILPLVVLTMIVERFYISIEENGLGLSLRLLAGTLGVGALCLALLRWRWLGQLAVSYPEAQLFVAAALVCVGRYSGYRLTELWRFRELAAPKQLGEDR
ncbi:MAG: 7TM domain-containing protein [Phycisphaerae bacterium]